MRDTSEYIGVRVLGGKSGTSKIGKIKCAVFEPENYRLVGYIIKRPDFAFVKARSDCFLALDSMRIIDGKVVGYADRDAWDAAACKRLRIDFDNCIILEGMPIVTNETRQPLGTVKSVVYDERNGKLDSIRVSDGALAKTMLGTQDIPAQLVIGYQDGAVWVQAEAEGVALSGGVAAKAGAGAAIVGDKVAKVCANAGSALEKAATDTAIKAGRKVNQAVKKSSDSISQKQTATSDKAAEAIDNGAKAVGRQLKASKGMFKAFRDEYRSAAGSKQKSAAGSKKKPTTGSKQKQDVRKGE